ncbi:MAG TPA: hemolysin family protein [Actinomycetaceae bacterium]|nr:hemolysin family protein [Actinomycetaceae bacterium]
MNNWIVLGVTVLLIAASAFFVIIEFSLLSARRHRLEAEAATSRAARAALRGMNELTIMLAGAQLGITVCTFALGAVTQPAIGAATSGFLESWGAPAAVSQSASFIVALLVVTFLHLVVGEMAPKSWAIARPEAAAKAIGPLSRGYTFLIRPLVVGINKLANRLVAASGVEPVDRAAVGGYDADTIRHLVEHSTDQGVLDETFREPLSGVLELQSLTVGALVDPNQMPTAVLPEAPVEDVREATARTGHMRILVQDSAGGIPDVIHVRNTLSEPLDRPVGELARKPLVLDATTPVYEGLATMRESSEQFAVVISAGRYIGVVTLNDVLRRVLPIAY